MFDRSLWKLSLALYGCTACYRACDIILWLFTPVSAPRKEKQEKTWPPRTAVCPTHSRTHLCFYVAQPCSHWLRLIMHTCTISNWLNRLQAILPAKHNPNEKKMMPIFIYENICIYQSFRNEDNVKILFNIEKQLKYLPKNKQKTSIFCSFPAHR